MLSAAPSPNIGASSPPDAASPSRASRFRRLTYLRSRSHSSGSSTPGHDTPRNNLAVRPSLSRTTSATDANTPSPLRGRTPNSTRDPIEATPTSPVSALLSPFPAEPEQEAREGLPLTDGNITRRRSATTSSLPMPSLPAPSGHSQRRTTHAHETTQASSDSTGSAQTTPRTAATAQQLPALRLVPFQDSRSTRPSLSFPTITRTLPSSSAILRIGRYSEKDPPPESIGGDTPSDAPIGFKSKVVSRKHCEFSCSDGSWWLKDVKSSSGTFLNHIRLSQPGEESRPYKVKDGDIVQLGIDFKGGEESIFRCVRMRIICDRGWQQGPNKFNTYAHKQLQQLKSHATTTTSKESTTDCTICLMAIGPCQFLFIAPCSHTWHYKCIRPLIGDPGELSYPHFLCPNCRAVADLEEDIEEPEPWISEEPADETAENTQIQNGTQQSDGAVPVPVADDMAEQAHEIANTQETLSNGDHESEAEHNAKVTEDSPTDASEDDTVASTALQQRFIPNPNTSALSHAHHISMNIPATRTSDFFPAGWRAARSSHAGNRDDNSISANLVAIPDENLRNPTTPRPTMVGSGNKLPTFRIGSPEAEGLMTPRNDAGPFVFDGAASS